MGELELDQVRKANARTRCIFENGTESNLLMQSLASNLYKDGRRVTEPNEVTLERMGLETETKMGHIYVLRSLSDDPQLAAFGERPQDRLHHADRGASNRWCGGRRHVPGSAGRDGRVLLSPRRSRPAGRGDPAQLLRLRPPRHLVRAEPPDRRRGQRVVRCPAVRHRRGDRADPVGGHPELRIRP